jgi:hypothetical protein
MLQTIYSIFGIALQSAMAGLKIRTQDVNSRPMIVVGIVEVAQHAIHSAAIQSWRELVLRSTVVSE